MAGVNQVFDAPIPGQSLTQAPGASPIEHPPVFVHLDDALEYVWDQLHTKKALVQLQGLMKSGVPAEAMARTILYKGLMSSKWTVDLALLMFQTVIWQIEAIAKLKGIKIETFNEDKQYNTFMVQMDYLQQQKQITDAANDTMDSMAPEPEPEKKTFKGFNFGNG